MSKKEDDLSQQLISHLQQEAQDKLLLLTKTIEQDPRRARERIMNSSPGKEAIRVLSQVMVDEGRRLFDWLPVLYTTYLHPLKNGSTILHLGSGSGYELMAMKELTPSAQLFAVDKEVSLHSIATEIHSGTRFIEADFNRSSTNEILRRMGQVPNIVVCRHPNVTKPPIWLKVLGEWGEIVQKSGGKFLITTFASDERQDITKEFDKRRIPYNLAEFHLGLKTRTPNYKIPVQFDRYVCHF